MKSNSNNNKFNQEIGKKWISNDTFCLPQYSNDIKKKYTKKIVIDLTNISYERQENFLASILITAWIRYTQERKVLIPLIFAESEKATLLSFKTDEVITFKQIENQVDDILTNCNNMIERNLNLSGADMAIWLYYSKVKPDTLPMFGVNERFVIVKHEANAELLIEYNDKINKEMVNALLLHIKNISNFANTKEYYSEDIYAIPMLSKDEIKKIVYEWNDTDSDGEYLNCCLHQLFEKQAQDNPEALAIIYKNTMVTRIELDILANKFANYLISKGVKHGDVIGVFLDKSLNYVISILGILKCGGAYLPIDISYPSERVDYIIRDSQARYVVTEEYFSGKFKNTLILDRKILSNQLLDKPKVNSNPKDKCYVIYTSGSTGNPKGVVLNHQGRVNNFVDFIRRFSINNTDKVLAVSSTGFDMSAFDVLGTLAAGAQIVLSDTSIENQPMHWLKLIDKYQISIWHSAPAILRMLLNYAKIRRNFTISSLRLFLLGGDWIPIQLLYEVSKFSIGKVISLGGATEASMDSIIYEVNNIDASWRSVPYGKPMVNQKAYILGERLEVLPIGLAGDLYIGGIGVGDGYLNRPNLTKELFLDNPWDKRYKIYKTGDHARFHSDGNIELLGRSDYQVKIKGVRIELGEIESKLKSIDEVADAIVLVNTYNVEEKRIVAFIVFKNEEINSAKIRRKLKVELPKEFIPSSFVPIEKIPITPNGKVDRKILKKILNEGEDV